MNSLYLNLVLLTAASVSQAALGDNIIESMAGASDFMLSLFYIVGIAMIFAGVNKLKRLGHRTAFMNVDSGVSGPLIMLLIGAVMIFMPSFLEVLNKSIWGTADIADLKELTYVKDDSSMEAKLRPVIMIVQFIGLVAMLRGFLILTKVTGQGAQPGTVSKGMIHIFGGILAVNIVRTVEIAINTFGG